MIPYDFLDLARSELIEAVAWYDKQRDGLGDEFLEEVVATVHRIRTFPDAWQKLSARSRRCRLRRFPYGIVYQHVDDRILVLALMHLHRSPDYWMDRERQ